MTRITKGNNGITQKFSSTHRGVDIGWHSKESDNVVIAHTSGKVVGIATGYSNNKGATGMASYGNYVKIKHDNGYYTLYAHLDSVNVSKGSSVSKGQQIGVMGNTGNSYGRHLHFEVRNTSDVRINPTEYINADLPNSNTSSVYTYQTYDNVKKKWLPKVKTSSLISYGGNFKHSVGGFRINGLTYMAHDKVKNKWLPQVSGDGSYAGNLGNAIDGIAISSTTLKYRVHIKGGKWLSWVSGYNTNDKSNGYGGILGKEIDAIQIKKK